MAPRFLRLSAIAVSLLACFATLTIWMHDSRAVLATECGIFLLGAVWATRMLLQPTRLLANSSLFVLAALPLWGLAQIALGKTAYRWATWNATLAWTAVWVIYAVGLQCFANPEIRKSFLRGLLCCGLILSVVSVLQYYTSGGKVFWVFSDAYPDLMGPFANRNHFASFAQIVVPIALWEGLCDPRRQPRFFAITAVLIAAVVACASRAGSLLVVAEVVVVLTIAWVRRVVSTRRLSSALAILSVFTIVLVTLVGPQHLWNRLHAQDPFEFRREIARSTLAMIAEHPWTGFGLGTYAVVYPAYASFDSGQTVPHAHDDWAEWAAEGGVPFALLLVAVVVSAVRPALHFPWAIGILAVFVHAAVDYPMQRIGLAAWVFLLLAALAAESRVLSSTSPPLEAPIPNF